MSIKIKHWTERSIKDYMFRISSDFVEQIQTKMDSESMTQQEVASRLKVSKGRVSQLFNNPGNLTLSNIVKISRVIGVKVSIVAYDDGDPQNLLGPVNSEVFTICWKKAGKPHDFWNLKSTQNQFQDIGYIQYYPGVTAADVTVTPVTGQAIIADFKNVATRAAGRGTCDSNRENQYRIEWNPTKMVS